MHDWAIKLLAVQDIDIKMGKTDAQLALVPSKQAEADQLFEAENQTLEKAKLCLKEAEVAGKKLENEIVTQQEKKRNFQSKTILIKSNEEYRAALLQIEMCDQVIKNLEDQQLEKMFEIDALKEEVANQQKEVELAKKRAQSVKEEYEVLKENCEKQLVQLKSEREQAAAEVDPELLRHYTHLRSGRNQNPTHACLVPIIDGACGRCRMRMTAQTCQDTINGKTVFCPSCAAMIYAE
jgi:predicted  nucleic acid-binding Zn-ribbon protein